MGKYISTDDFIKKAISVHGNKYDYSKVNYIHSGIKVEIICRLHGGFLQTPASHNRGAGCPKCKGEKNRIRCSVTKEDFIKKARKIHGDVYSYSESSFINNYTKIDIICKKHGKFSMLPGNHIHIKQRQGCPRCGKEQKFKTRDEFVEESSIIHRNKYDYSKTKYEHNRIKVEIICPFHGSFFQTPDRHIQGRGCPRCNSSKGELKVKDYLDKNNIKYEHQKKFPDCVDQKQLIFDFYIPLKNLFIEYNGIQHYRDVHFFTKNGTFGSFKDQQKRYSIKKSYAESRGSLLEIRYDEDIEKKLDEVFKHD